MNLYEIAFEINSELFGGDQFVDLEDVDRVKKIIKKHIEADQHETWCTWSGGNTPCEHCPQKITAIHMCKLLQDCIDPPEGIKRK